MDVTSLPGPGLGPPPANDHSSPEMEQANNPMNGNMDTHVGLHVGSGSTAMASSAHGPKVVQTAFIHKLYSMLEDKTIQHLISWSNTNESFVMSPSTDFSKVLSQYFKHTNISSFVRQLNMYGFHKVSDVFHGGSPDSTLWEFRHGNGSFKKGDLVGLRDIKRRASKHALIHRDSFSGHKGMPPQPGTPAEPVMDPMEQRIATLEHTVYRMSQHISQAEDSLTVLGAKYHAMTDTLIRCHEWSYALSVHVQSLAPTDSSLKLGVPKMQKEITRQIEMVRGLYNPHDSLLNGRQPYFGNMSLDSHAASHHPSVHPPLSPRHNLFDDSRRSSVQAVEPPSASFGQGYVGRPANLPTSPRSYGMTNMSNHDTSPNNMFNRPALPLHPPSVISAASYDDGPNLARRHTSADIRQNGWPTNVPPVPSMHSHSSLNIPNNSSHYPSANPASAWPSSPHRTPMNHPYHGSQNEHQHLHDQLASYEMNAGSSRRRAVYPSQIRPITPPPISVSQNATPNEHVGWSLTTGSSGGAGAGARAASGGHGSTTVCSEAKYTRLGQDLHSAPATRRGSMASNVHSLLNPTDTAGRPNEDDDGPGFGGGDERKRKRM